MQEIGLDAATNVLRAAVAEGQVHAASLYVWHRGQVWAQSFGAAGSTDDIFLVASLSKPMTVAALMTLYDHGELRLDHRVKKFIPEFSDSNKGTITVQQLLTHIAGLPDQLPENEALRKRRAALPEFIAEAICTPLLFTPGSRYSYSSMGILLAAEVAQRITGLPFQRLIDETVFQPLEMDHSALGLGRFQLEATMRCQLEGAGSESGDGEQAAEEWNRNSPYWRHLGAPWGGVHASAPDVAKFFHEFLHGEGKVLRPETARLMCRNHNPQGVRPHGLGFAVGPRAGSSACSEETFGHRGVTGTLAWADPATDTVCVVLTTLPASAASPHPREVTSDYVAKAVA